MCGVYASIAPNVSSVQCPVQVLRMNVAREQHTLPPSTEERSRPAVSQIQRR